MAKKKSNKGKGSYATYAAASRATTNLDKRMKRLAKNHPNDAQSLDNVKGTQRKAPRVKGAYPEQKNYWYDGAGHKFLMPSFEPYLKQR